MDGKSPFLAAEEHGNTLGASFTAAAQHAQTMAHFPYFAPPRGPQP